mmetsp:Transcript_124575/g.360259  ORF Transcript_124575/g.360259 Transcript_124575/m.360259 type:complete len:214 (+) Transcript_124575:240-881(+)
MQRCPCQADNWCLYRRIPPCSFRMAQRPSPTLRERRRKQQRPFRKRPCRILRPYHTSRRRRCLRHGLAVLCRRPGPAPATLMSAARSKSPAPQAAARLRSGPFHPGPLPWLPAFSSSCGQTRRTTRHPSPTLVCRSRAAARRSRGRGPTSSCRAARCSLRRTNRRLRATLECAARRMPAAGHSPPECPAPAPALAPAPTPALRRLRHLRSQAP